MEADRCFLRGFWKKATKFLKQFFLQEHITELSKAGFFEEAEYLKKKIEELLTEEDNLSWKSLICMPEL